MSKHTCIAKTIATLCFLAAITSLGCDNKETVLDIETPGGEVEVQRDRDSGDVKVEVRTNNGLANS